MDTNKALTMFLAATLALSVYSLMGISIPVASAQSGVTVTTSADGHGKKFFGEGVLEVIIEDDDTDDSNDTINVSVEIDGDTQTHNIDDTSDGSQRFVFYLVHEDSGVSPADPESAEIITFGPTGVHTVGVALYEEADIEITYRSTTVTVDYAESLGKLTLDDDVFGTESIAYFTIQDNDGNLDPTAEDTFSATDIELDGSGNITDLFSRTGLDFNTTLTFTETSDNSAMFEAAVQLNSQVDLLSQSATLELHNKADYADLANPENDSTDTSDVSFTVENEDGEMDNIGTITMGSEIKITVRDYDQNRDSDSDETLVDAIQVTAGSDVELVDLEETGDDTAVFVLDLSNNELRVTFNATSTSGNGILELTPSSLTDDILIEYLDSLDDSIDFNDVAGAPVVTSSFETELTLGSISLTVPTEVGVNDDFVLSVTDPNLNDNPRTRDSYTVDFTSGPTNGIFPLNRGTTNLGVFAELEIEVEGDSPQFDAGGLTITILETGINTGIFEADIDMAELIEAANPNMSLDDGDNIEFTYTNKMDDVDRDAADELSIGRPGGAVDFSRDVLPIPPLDVDQDGPDSGDSPVAIIGNQVAVELFVTDPDENDSSSAQDSIDFIFGNGNGQFTIDIEGDGVSDVTIDDDSEYDTDIQCGSDFQLVSGVCLEDILPNLNGTTLTETSASSGVFSETLSFMNDGDMDENDWQDLEITINYNDNSGEEQSGGIIFRGNDAQLTVDKSAVRGGDILTITVVDEDLNLDDDLVEEFEGANSNTDPWETLVLVETEDELDQIPSTETFTETGPNTGIFVAEYEVGTDIPVTAEDDDGDIEQASSILLTYDDVVDSTGGSGDEVEIDVAVVTSTGTIRVTPELVGPSTTLTVLIVDNDLNQDSASTDDYPGDDQGDGIVVFRSSEDDAGEASPELEETGPNTGVFEFELELAPAADCADEDYDPAEGGSEPTMDVCPGDLISIRYDDENTANGRSTTVSTTIEIQSWDPEFASDKDSYSTEDRATVTISDPDANEDPDVADSLQGIRVFSNTDRVGEEFSALETGKDTGVFRVSFGLSSGTQSGSVSVRTGDVVTIEYNDEFPGDFAEEEEDKDFSFTIDIGGNVGTDTTSPTPPVLRDVSGNAIDEVSRGQQVVLTTSIENNNDSEVPFVAIIEVRDSSGFTVFLAWQTGTLNPSGNADVGLSWTPEFSGDYTVRTFIISNLQSPAVLSPVEQSEITVN